MKLALGLTAALFLAGIAHSAPPTYAGAPDDLAKAARAFDEAQIKGDAAVLRATLSEDYKLVNGRAQVESKAEFVQDFTAPGFHLDQFTVREPVQTVWSDGAVLGGLVDFKGTDGGKPFSQTFRFADIWAKRDARWQVVFTEVTPVPAPKPGS